MAASGAIHSADDARTLAKRRLPWMIFDYIDAAAGDGMATRRNRAAINAAPLRPRILRDVSRRSLQTSLFGITAARPFGIAPMGMCNLSDPQADMMLANLAARFSIPLGVSTLASTPMEKMIETANGHAWFQLYFSGDGEMTFKLARRAIDAGYKTLILTVDVPEIGRRPRELRHGFKMPFRIGVRQFIDFALHPRWSLRTLGYGKPQTANFLTPDYVFDRTQSRAKADWDMLAKLRDMWPGNLVVKGVLDTQDAIELKSKGIDAIQISSHGGRQLQSTPAPFDMIAPFRQALDDDFPIFYDSDLRSGEEALKVLLKGANFAFFGRIWQFAIAAAGEKGLAKMWDVITDEMSIAMAQTGMCDLPSQTKADR